MLNLIKIQEILAAEVLVGDNLIDTVIHSACGADLMSDVLAFTKENTLLLEWSTVRLLELLKLVI